jgi:hypothetical protein
VCFEAAGAAGGGAVDGEERERNRGGGLGLNLRPAPLRFGRGSAPEGAAGLEELKGAESDSDFIDLIEDENEENGLRRACSDSDRSLACASISAHVRVQMFRCGVVCKVRCKVSGRH